MVSKRNETCWNVLYKIPYAIGAFVLRKDNNAIDQIQGYNIDKEGIKANLILNADTKKPVLLKDVDYYTLRSKWIMPKKIITYNCEYENHLTGFSEETDEVIDLTKNVLVRKK